MLLFAIFANGVSSTIDFEACLEMSEKTCFGRTSLNSSACSWRSGCRGLGKQPKPDRKRLWLGRSGVEEGVFGVLQLRPASAMVS